jgi:hypothetical protein
MELPQVKEGKHSKGFAYGSLLNSKITGYSAERFKNHLIQRMMTTVYWAEDKVEGSVTLHFQEDYLCRSKQYLTLLSYSWPV